MWRGMWCSLFMLAVRVPHLEAPSTPKANCFDPNLYALAKNKLLYNYIL